MASFPAHMASLFMIGFILHVAVVAHDPSVVPYEVVPGYIDCSQTDPRKPNFALKKCEAPRTKDGAITIACVGDSITAGGWPQLMQTNLNAKYPGKYNVINFGECGSTMQRHADSPYWLRPSWPVVLNTSADVIIIMLGTNDAKTAADGGPSNWEDDGKTGYLEYVMSYAAMIQQFRNLPSKPDVYTTIPPPNYKNGVYGMNGTVINAIFPAVLPVIASENTPNHLPLDIFSCMGGASLSHPELFGDGCHPNAQGYAFLAKCFQTALGL